MLFVSWYFQLFKLIPEAVGLVFLGTALVKEHYTYKKLLLAALIYGGLGFALFQLPVTYGKHIPLGIILFILVLKIALNMNILKSVLASLLSFFILIISETLTIPIMLLIKGYSLDNFQELLSELGEKEIYLIGLPSLLLLLALALLAQLWLKFRARSDVSRFQ